MNRRVAIQSGLLAGLGSTAHTRAADGRYVMAFMFTNVLLRPDLDDNYVSIGFDNDRAR